MAPNLPLPPQLSTDPAVNASAMAWAAQLVDALQKIISGSTASGVNADKLDGIDSLGFLQLVAAVFGAKLAFGTGVATFPGGSVSAAVNVTHGLGTTPQIVLMTPKAQSGLNYPPEPEADTYGATTFRGTVWTIDAQLPVNGSTATFAWLAIG